METVISAGFVLAQTFAQSLFHLAGGLVGERDRGYPGEGRPLHLNQVNDFLDDDAGFAAARPGHDQ